MLVPVVWVAVVLVQVVVQLRIERRLARWVREANLRVPSSGQYGLGPQTYELVLTGAARPICLVAGVYLTWWPCRWIELCLASAGVVAVAIGFLSRSLLLEGMLNGTLILLNDRYAIGDGVTIWGGGRAYFGESESLIT